jgi:glycosyltransferase involved in cell wall biosynthesis
MARPDCGRASPRVIALFADDAESSLRVIRHVREGAQGTPVWLYSTAQPPPGVTALCNHVVVCGNPVRLLLTAQRQLWPLRAALAVGTWTGRGGSGLLKLCPFLVPPFRSLFLNRNGDFLPGTPKHMAVHCRHRLSERAHDVAVRCCEINSAIWQLLRYHIWRSAPVRRAKDHTAAAALLAVATLLRWCAYPHRRFFSRLHGDHPLDTTLPLSSADSTEVVCFYQHDHHWDFEAISQLTALSDARWLVWHSGSGLSPIDELLPLFDDSATFAVSRQSSFRAWKPVLLPTAPFRTLQRGECTRIMAPLGSTIVVDRRKLEALGIPDVSHPITAFLLLFWKAAAAGWICYSVGQEKRLEPEPDFPSEETAFLLRVALAPGLRALGPREPLLARGTVAFSADRTPINPSASLRPRILIVSPFLPYPLSHGGAVRIYNLCRALSGRVDFALIAVRENQESVNYAKLHEVFREVRIVDIDQVSRASGDLPEPVRRHECPTLRAVIADVCRSWRPNLVQFEYTQTAALKDTAAGIPAILVEHDITFSLYGQLAETEPCRKSRREYRRWLTFENYWLGAYDAVWTMSEADRSLAINSGRRDPSRTFCVPNGVDTERFRPRDSVSKEPEVLYVGSFRHLPNLIAFHHLRTAIMPIVWERFPDAVLHVVAGPRHQYFWKHLDYRSHAQPLDSRIVLHDFVEDLRPRYARATVVVAPLQVSAGTNIKVMEAMACGKAVVSTPMGCAGLDLTDDCDLLIRSGAAAFATAVCTLLAEPALRAKIGAQARQTVESRFSWGAIAEFAWQSYTILSQAFQGDSRLHRHC